MEKFYTKRFDSLKGRLWDLSQCRGRDYKNDTIVLSGMIAKFNMTFDLSWKVLKDIVTGYHGVTDYILGSPRENLKAAFKCGLIEDDEIWFEIMKLRNRLSHDYNSELAYEACDRIIGEYLDFFLEFERKLEEFFNTINGQK